MLEKTYMAWRNVRYRVGYSETMIGRSLLHLATFALGRIGRFSWNMVFGTSRKPKLTIHSAMKKSLSEARLMVELLPKSMSFGRMGGKPSNKGEPANKTKTKPMS